MFILFSPKIFMRFSIFFHDLFMILSIVFFGGQIHRLIDNFFEKFTKRMIVFFHPYSCFLLLHLTFTPDPGAMRGSARCLQHRGSSEQMDGTGEGPAGTSGLSDCLSSVLYSPRRLTATFCLPKKRSRCTAARTHSG